MKRYTAPGTLTVVQPLAASDYRPLPVMFPNTVTVPPCGSPIDTPCFFEVLFAPQLTVFGWSGAMDTQSIGFLALTVSLGMFVVCHSG